MINISSSLQNFKHFIQKYLIKIEREENIQTGFFGTEIVNNTSSLENTNGLDSVI